MNHKELRKQALLLHVNDPKETLEIFLLLTKADYLQAKEEDIYGRYLDWKH